MHSCMISGYTLYKKSLNKQQPSIYLMFSNDRYKLWNYSDWKGNLEQLAELEVPESRLVKWKGNMFQFYQAS